jgi:hypothetical protein
MHATTPAVVLLAACSARAQEVIVPNASANLEGSTRNSYPFSALAPASQRVQQVYAASQFSAITGTGRINELRFRPDGQFTFPAWSNDIIVQIRMSTTAAAPDALNLTFANNIGLDETLVYSGPATISTAQTGPSPTPQAFDVVLTLQTPFAYNPANGNLLVDVIREGFTLSVPRYLDAEAIIGDAVSRVYTSPTSSSTALFGSGDSTGLITKFIFQSTGGCYPNCDNSTATPVLNVQDFTCFLQRYAAGDSYANCDNSTAAPTLNVQDFTCFLQRYAAGCP